MKILFLTLAFIVVSTTEFSQVTIKPGDNFDEFSDELESFDIVFFGGLGYDFPFGLTLEARYNIGLVDIFGYNIDNEVSIDDVLLNKVIQKGAAYKFDI